MVDITPGVAFLAALQNQFNAARQGQGQGTNSLIPGLPGSEGADSGSVIGALGSGGISAGGVPGTATTGSSIANSLIGGGAGASDPLAQQVSLASGFGFGEREPGERGDLGAGVTGGDADLLMSILSGNPLLIAAAVAQAVSNQGVPQGFGVDATGGTPFQFGDSSSGLGFRDSGLNLGSNAGVNFNNNPLTNPVGGVSFGGGDSTPGASGGGPGAGPNRGAERAGNRGR